MGQMTPDTKARAPIPDIMDPGTIRCPYEAYAQIREQEPVYWYERGGFYVVTRMRDIRKILSNPSLFSSAVRPYMGFGPELNRVTLPGLPMIMSDPPVHTRTRALVSRAFTAPMANAMEPRITAIVNKVVDGFIHKKKIEVFSELAFLVPIHVIAGELGVPREDIDKFRKWSDAISYAVNQGEGTTDRERHAALIGEFNDYILAKRAEKIRNPADDMISVLAVSRSTLAEDGVEEEPLTDEEFISMAQLLLVGGNETTTATILSGVKILAKQPQLFQALKADRSQIRGFNEELLRIEGPIQGFWRIVMEDTEVAGVPIKKGTKLHLRYGSANRDEEIFECPTEFQLGRKNLNQHLAFGGGIHVCVGQMLARKELECVLKVLCDRIKTIRLADADDSAYWPVFTKRALEHLNVEIEAEDPV